MVENVNDFEDLRIVDNFYQTSSFYPMPIVAITTLNEEGETNIGPYSLIFPYYIAGKDYYSMLLLCRNNSNTGINILQNRKCAINFLPDNKKFMKQCVRLGFPGDTTKEKMKGCIFNLADGLRQTKNPSEKYPKIITDAFQVFECTWMAELENADRFKPQEEFFPPFNNFNGVTSKFGLHLILRVDHILMKPKYRKEIIDGVKSKSFPPVPVDFGYRDNTNFWISQGKRPYPEPIPKDKGNSLNTVKYAADRMDPKIKFSEEACKKLVRVPRIFLKQALQGCVDWAEKNNVTTITAEHMDVIRDKRSAEKK